MKPIHWRRTRIGKYLRHIPRPKHLRGSWLHKKIGDSLLHNDLWRPERTKVAAGFAIGAFWSMIPMPLQMIPSVFFAYITRVNIAAAVVGVWITNPVTAPPVFYLQFKLGHWLLGMESVGGLDTSQGWLELLKQAPLAIFCGGIVTGIFSAAAGYPLALLFWDTITQLVKKSRERRASKKTHCGHPREKNPRP